MDKITRRGLFRYAFDFGVKHSETYERSHLEEVLTARMKDTDKNPEEKLNLYGMPRDNLILVAKSLYIKTNSKNKKQLRDDIVEVNELVGLYIIRRSEGIENVLTVSGLKRYLNEFDKQGTMTKEKLMKMAIKKFSDDNGYSTDDE